MGFGAGASGVGLEDVELGLGDGVGGAVGGEDVFFVGGVVFGGEGDVHCWLGSGGDGSWCWYGVREVAEV